LDKDNAALVVGGLVAFAVSFEKVKRQATLFTLGLALE